MKVSNENENFVNEKKLASNILNRFSKIEDTIAFVKENYNIDVTYNSETNELDILQPENINESLNYTLAKDYILEHVDNTLWQIK